VSVVPTKKDTARAFFGPDMHSVVCRLVLRPDPTGGAYSAPLAGLWGGAAWGRGTREGRGKERGRERKGGEWEGRGLDERGSWTLRYFQMD